MILSHIGLTGGFLKGFGDFFVDVTDIRGSLPERNALCTFREFMEKTVLPTKYVIVIDNGE